MRSFNCNITIVYYNIGKNENNYNLENVNQKSKYYQAITLYFYTN